MAQNTKITLPPGEWTQITDADVTTITFQNQSGGEMWVVGAADATAPSGFEEALTYAPGSGERNAALADLFPGISAVRVYAYSAGGAQVFVSHA